MSDLKNRKGKFYITKPILQDSLEDISKIISDLEFVPYRVEFLYYNNSLELIGVSKYFEPIENNVMTPTYDIRLEFDDANGVTIEEIVRIEN